VYAGHIATTKIVTVLNVGGGAGKEGRMEGNRKLEQIREGISCRGVTEEEWVRLEKKRKAGQGETCM